MPEQFEVVAGEVFATAAELGQFGSRSVVVGNELLEQSLDVVGYHCVEKGGMFACHALVVLYYPVEVVAADAHSREDQVNEQLQQAQDLGSGHC